MDFKKSNLALHIEVYREAGSRLIKTLSEDQSFQRELALPISSLYRLYLELSLKQLIFLGNQFLVDPIQWKNKKGKEDNHALIAGFPTNHNLDDLQTICLQILRQLEIDFPSIVKISDLGIDLLNKCIQTFFSASLTEDPFRYPNDLEGKSFLPDRYYVNVYQIKEIIDRVDTLFFDQALLIMVDLYQQRATRDK